MVEVNTDDMQSGPFSEYDEKLGWIHYGAEWPKNPFDWRFGCTVVPPPER